MPEAKFKDINLNFTIHPLKKDIVPITDVDAIKQSVKTLILTKPYERPFHPEKGCIVTALLFENFTPLTTASIERSIKEVLAAYEPRVEVLDVIQENNPDAHAINVSIIFRILNRPEPITVDIILERIR
jgi:phage baseplate assembly protein W